MFIIYKKLSFFLTTKKMNLFLVVLCARYVFNKKRDNNKNRFNMMRIRKATLLMQGLMIALTLAFSMTSCGDDEEKKGIPHNPSLPVVIESIAPTEGMLATQVIVTGSNFGTDKENLHVFFNDKEAPVISSSGNKILVLAPKLPGKYVNGELDNNCKIRVTVGDKEATAPQTFFYEVNTIVTTVVGGDRNATSYPLGGEALAEVQFNGNLDHNMVIDSENNIYFGYNIGSGDNPYSVYVINEESGKIRLLDSNITGFLNNIFLGYDPIQDRCYRLFKNVGSHETYYYDRYNDFAQTRGFTMNWIQPETGINDQPPVDGWNSWACKHSLAVRPSDGKWYMRIDQGYFVKIDPQTGQMTDISGRYDRRHDNNGSGFAGNGGECDGMAFDPTDDTKLYFSMTGLNAIMLYDFETETVSLYAGSSSQQPGYLDGRRTEAIFNSPRQIAIDNDRNMYIADYNNHCIRKIVMETGYVTTMAGVPQVSGYTNGTGEVAQFNHPYGLVLSKDGTIYVGDSENRAIRRIAIE